MANYRVNLTISAARRESVEKKLREAFNGDTEITFTVEKIKSAESRADRLAEAESMADQARSIVEELKDEMEQWYDSIPENLQQGSKAQEVEECKDMLDELQGNLEQLDFGSVSFPGMF